MTVVNTRNCRVYLADMCDSKGMWLSESGLANAAKLMVRFLTKGELMETIPAQAVEDAANTAILCIMEGITA